MSFSKYTIEEVFNLLDDEWNALLSTTYSLSPEVLYFLYNRHLKHKVDPGCIHVLVDARKIDESAENNNDRKAFLKLQKEMSICSELMEGSFHPKMFLFANNEKLALILSTGNITTSGVLSGADLVSYVELNEKNKDLFIGVYGFIKKMKGWNSYAREVMKILESQHKWITKNESTSFMYSRDEKPLIDQMMDKIKAENIIKLKVFTPFLSLDKKLFKKFKVYQEFPIEIYYGREEVDVQKIGEINNLKNDNVDFVDSADLNVWPFHAKMYHFILKKGSRTFWGSANCTLSALSIPKRNSEYLLESDISTDDFNSLVFKEDALGKKISPKENVVRVNDDGEKIIKYHDLIDSCFLDGVNLKISFSKVSTNLTDVLLRDVHGNIITRKVVFSTPNEVVVQFNHDKDNIPVFVAPSNQKERSGPWVLVLDENKIFNRSSSDKDFQEMAQKIASLDIKSLMKVKNSLEFETEKSDEVKQKGNNKKGSQAKEEKIKTWIPNARQSSMSYQNSYSAFRRGKTWENKDDQAPDDKSDNVVNNVKTEDEFEYDPIDYLADEVKNVIKKLSKLENNGSLVIKESLARMMEHYSQFLIRDFSQNDYGYDLEDLMNCLDIFSELSQVICFTYQPITASLLEVNEKTVEREAVFGAIVYLYFITSNFLYEFKMKTFGNEYLLSNSDSFEVIHHKRHSNSLKKIFDYFNKGNSVLLKEKIFDELDFLNKFFPSFLINPSVLKQAFEWSNVIPKDRPVLSINNGDMFFLENRGLIECIDCRPQNPVFVNGGYKADGSENSFVLMRAFILKK